MGPESIDIGNSILQNCRRDKANCGRNCKKMSCNLPEEKIGAIYKTGPLFAPDFVTVPRLPHHAAKWKDICLYIADDRVKSGK